MFNFGKHKNSYEEISEVLEMTQFDMNEIGKRISNHRKKMDMTQTELADKLGISFQAVSNWERGQSMPDISKLPELSQILDCSIDDILGNTAPITAAICNDEIENKEITAEELANEAPILKPSQVDDLYENIVKSDDISELKCLFPFLGEDFCDELFEKYCEKGFEFVPGSLIPHVSSKTLQKTVIKAYKPGELKQLRRFLPYLSAECLNEIAKSEYEHSGLSGFSSIAPYMSSENLAAFAADSINKHGIGSIKHIAPFLSSDFLKGFIRKKYI